MVRSVVIASILAFTAGVGFGRFVLFTDTRNVSDDKQPVLTPPVLTSRLDRIDGMLREISDGMKRAPQAVQPGLGSSPNYVEGKNDASVMADRAKLHPDIKRSILTSLSNPGTNLSTLLRSDAMRSLTPEQQDEIMQEIVVQINSGQLSKEQFLPGYRQGAITK